MSSRFKVNDIIKFKDGSSKKVVKATKTYFQVEGTDARVSQKTGRIIKKKGVYVLKYGYEFTRIFTTMKRAKKFAEKVMKAEGWTGEVYTDTKFRYYVSHDTDIDLFVEIEFYELNDDEWGE